MKISIRTKFILGVIFFFIIIVVLLVLSTFELNNLSKKTSRILKENHYSVVYAREMSEALTIINQEINQSLIFDKYPDSVFIEKKLIEFEKSLQLEKNNFTEVGEDKLVATIETNYIQYFNGIGAILKLHKPSDKLIFLQNKFIELNEQLMLLSQMNEKAIELKTNDAKVSAKKAFGLMTIIGTFCFFIALTFTYNFASYFSGRFFQLHNGIKELASSNYGHRLYFNGNDEFYDIALVFNQMAEKLNINAQKLPKTEKIESEKKLIKDELEEVKRMLEQMKNLEEQANELISKFKSLNG
jgi:two-component system, NtrC family, sensor histidine kinase KinB